MTIIVSCQRMEVSKVSIERVNGNFELLVNKQLFNVKGAGINWDDGHNFSALKEAGGNAFRTWTTTNLKKELDSAKKYGFMVAVGLNLEKELHGFDYRTQTEEVKAQFERVKQVVDTYKDHPNLLCWIAGNELNLILTDEGERPMVDPSVYEALSDIVDYIHEVDPNHPVTTAFAGTRKSDVDLALTYCPDLDFLSFQVYGGLGQMPELISELQLDKPFMITEFGPMGHWEMPATAWGREIEEPSAVKAAGLANRMKKGIKEDKSGLNIGHFVFEWGQKQERTPTWYGIFNKSGEPDARIDEITKFWTGEYPDNRAPLVEAISLNSLSPVDNITLQPNVLAEANVTISDADTDSLTFRWEIMKEVDSRSKGGAFEKEPETIEIQLSSEQSKEIAFQIPQEPGAYRLFAYVYDGKGKVGNANVPFYVQQELTHR